jgi:peptidoglycan/LPS O-acetylase OafA/YrhL
VGSDLAEAWEGFPMLGLTLATLAFAVACATVSYYVVERPIMRWSQARRRRSEPRAPAPQPEPARSVEPAL